MKLFVENVGVFANERASTLEDCSETGFFKF